MTTHRTRCISGTVSALLALSSAAGAQTPTLPSAPHFVEAPDSPFRVGMEPICAAVGDFNGDGKLDLAIVNSERSRANASVTVLLGNGKGGFTEAQGSPFPAGSNPESLAVGDFNGDGKPDSAIASFSGGITVLLGNGKGGFTEARRSPFPVRGAPDFVVVGDFNGDGRPDLAIATFTGGIAVLLNDGKGGFADAPGSPFAAGGDPRSLVVGDFNGDGKPDLAISNRQSSNVTVLLGDGKGGFAEAPGSPVTVASSPGCADSVAVGDFNGDRKLDLVTADTGRDKVTVLLGDGKGGFTAAPGNPVQASDVGHVAVGDFNGDGKADLVIANRHNNNVTVLLGNGTGGFSPATGTPFRVGMEPWFVAAGDFNGDGKPDVAIVNYAGHNVTVLLNNSPGLAPAKAQPRGVAQ